MSDGKFREVKVDLSRYRNAPDTQPSSFETYAKKMWTALAEPRNHAAFQNAADRIDPGIGTVRSAIACLKDEGFSVTVSPGFHLDEYTFSALAFQHTVRVVDNPPMVLMEIRGSQLSYVPIADYLKSRLS